MNKKLYVGNLEYGVRDNDLNELFAQFGQVVSANVVMDKFNPNRSRGYGFVEMSTEEEAQAALSLHDQEFKGRKLVVNEARPPKSEEGEEAPVEA